MQACALCGEEMTREEKTDEHVPPKLFYPRAMRPSIKARLWTVPSHRACNEKYKLDEEYLYYFMMGMVARQNPVMGDVLLADVRHRAKNPQTRALVRRFISETKHTTPGGIILPPTVRWIAPDFPRIQNVVVKIAQCLFFKDHTTHLPRAWCKHVELCQTPQDLQQLFELMRHIPSVAVVPEVFSYRYFCLDGTHYYVMVFWHGFAFCLAFDDPNVVQSAKSA
jgi:hypothetical protein